MRRVTEAVAPNLHAVLSGEDPGDAWDAFVSGHRAGHLMQSRPWAWVQRELGWQPIFFHLMDSGRFRAAALLLRWRVPGTRLSLIYIPRGPVVDYGDPEALAILGGGIRRIAHSCSAFLVQTDPAVPRSCEEAHAALLRLGFVRVEKQGLFRIGQPTRVMRIPLDVYGAPERLLSALPHKTRYNIGVARRHGVTIVARTDQAACRDFYGLLTSSGRRKGFAVRGFQFHKAVWRRCVEPGFGEYLFAQHAGRTLAAIQVLRFGSTAWYMYGASEGEDRNLMPTYLLQWEGIQRAWASGCTCYDMRGVYSANPKPQDPEYGVYEFKRRFNAELVQLLGEYDQPIRVRAYGAWRRLEAAVQRPASWAIRLWSAGGPK